MPEKLTKEESEELRATLTRFDKKFSAKMAELEARLAKLG